VTPPRLSKTRYISGCQCHLKLWYDCFERELGADVDAVTQAIFDTGHEVGRLARQRYPGGVLVEADHLHPEDAIAQTRALLADETIPAIFEAAFEHRGVLIRADVLERSTRGGFNLIEVKSGTTVKDVHEHDVAVQMWVLRGAGIDVASVGLLTLGRGYVFDGKSLDVYRLFRFHNGSTSSIRLPIYHVCGVPGWSSCRVRQSRRSVTYRMNFDSVTARPSFGSRSSQEKSTLLHNFKKSCSWYRIQSAIWISRASARPSPAMPVRVATTPSHSSSPCIVKIETAMCRNANSCGQRRVIREGHSQRRYSMRSVMTGPSASTPGSRDV
jgi:hypothetical protein